MSSPGGSFHNEAIKNGVSQLVLANTVSSVTAAYFQGLNTLGFDSLWWDIDDLFPTGSGINNLVMQVKVGGAWQGTSYGGYGNMITYGNNSTIYYYGAGIVGGAWLNWFYLSSGAYNAPVAGRVRLLSNPAGAASLKQFIWSFANHIDMTNFNSNWNGGGLWNGSVGPLEGVSFFFEGANINRGTIRMYGMRTGM